MFQHLLNIPIILNLYKLKILNNAKGKYLSGKLVNVMAVAGAVAIPDNSKS